MSDGFESEKLRCASCGYVYDPAGGDPKAEVPPGTVFDELVESWSCPLCGASKTEFEPAIA